MLFSLKNPLNRKLSADDLLKSKRAQTQSGAFLGASLLNREACSLALHENTAYRISGPIETYAPNVANILARQAIEDRLSILLLDFQAVEDYWHRLWALSFNLDHAKDFRLFDFENEEFSDYLLGTLPEGTPDFLCKTEQAVDVEKHLTQAKGLIGVHAEAKHREALWNLVKNWLSFADFLVVLGWDQLSSGQQKTVFEVRKKSPRKRLAVVQSGFAADSENFEGFSEILFRQPGDMPQEIFEHLKGLKHASGMEKVWSKMNRSLDCLDDTQCLVEQNGTLELVQTNTGDGLPWPPDYKPLRSRFPGN